MSSSVSPIAPPAATPCASSVVAVSPVVREKPISAEATPLEQMPRGSRWKIFWQGERGKQLSSTLTSMLVHLLAVLILALWLFEVPRPSKVRTLSLSIDTPTNDLPAASVVTESLEPVVTPEIMAGPPVLPQQLLTSNTPELPTNNVPFFETPSPATIVPATSPSSATANVISQPVIGGLNGKDRRDRRSRAREEGATDGSEDAVEQALRWLSRHQRKDGAWRFDHHDGACDGSCGNPGNHASTTASTALALLIPSLRWQSFARNVL